MKLACQVDFHFYDISYRQFNDYTEKEKYSIGN